MLAKPITFPPTVHRLQFLHIHSNTCFSSFVLFLVTSLIGIRLYFIVMLIINNVDHFIYMLAICMSFLETCPFLIVFLWVSFFSLAPFSERRMPFPTSITSTPTSWGVYILLLPLASLCGTANYLVYST